MGQVTQEELNKLTINECRALIGEYYDLSTQPILSETECKRLEKILEVACENDTLSLMLGEIDEIILQAEALYGYKDTAKHEAQRTELVECIQHQIPTHQLVFEHAKLKLAEYEPVLSNYYRISTSPLISEIGERQMDRILRDAYKDGLLGLFIELIQTEILRRHCTAESREQTLAQVAIVRWQLNHSSIKKPLIKADNTSISSPKPDSQVKPLLPALGTISAGIILCCTLWRATPLLQQTNSNLNLPLAIGQNTKVKKRPQDTQDHASDNDSNSNIWTAAYTKALPPIESRNFRKALAVDSREANTMSSSNDFDGAVNAVDEPVSPPVIETIEETYRISQSTQTNDGTRPRNPLYVHSVIQQLERKVPLTTSFPTITQAEVNREAYSHRPLDSVDTTIDLATAVDPAVETPEHPTIETVNIDDIESPENTRATNYTAHISYPEPINSIQAPNNSVPNVTDEWSVERRNELFEEEEVVQETNENYAVSHVLIDVFKQANGPQHYGDFNAQGIESPRPSVSINIAQASETLRTSPFNVQSIRHNQRLQYQQIAENEVPSSTNIEPAEAPTAENPSPDISAEVSIEQDRSNSTEPGGSVDSTFNQNFGPLTELIGNSSTEQGLSRPLQIEEAYSVTLARETRDELISASNAMGHIEETAQLYQAENQQANNSAIVDEATENTRGRNTAANLMNLEWRLASTQLPEADMFNRLNAQRSRETLIASTTSGLYEYTDRLNSPSEPPGPSETELYNIYNGTTKPERDIVITVSPNTRRQSQANLNNDMLTGKQEPIEPLQITATTTAPTDSTIDKDSYSARLDFLSDEDVLEAAFTYINGNGLTNEDGAEYTIAGLINFDLGDLQIGGHYSSTSVSNTNETSSYMGNLSISDFFGTGNTFGVYAGVSPEETLAEENSPLLLEAYYQMNVREGVSFTPVFIYTASNDTNEENFYGALRASLEF